MLKVIFPFLFQLVVGAVTVAGVGAVVYADHQSNIAKVKDNNAKLAARIKTLEDNPYVLPSSISTSIAANTAKAAETCGQLKALDTNVNGFTVATPANVATDATNLKNLITMITIALC